MTKKILLLGVALMICIGLFAGCSDAELKLGTYVTDDGLARVVLSDNNEFTFIRGVLNYAPSGKYYIKGNNLTLKVTDGEEYIFEIKDGKLVYAIGDSSIAKDTVFKLTENK